MAQSVSAGKTSTSPADEIGDIVELVKAYAKQETIGPLRNAGRYLAFGLAGGFLLAFGLVLLLICALRVMQTQTDVFEGDWSWAPYLIVVIVGGVIVGLCLALIKKDSLDG